MEPGAVHIGFVGERDIDSGNAKHYAQVGKRLPVVRQGMPVASIAGAVEAYWEDRDQAEQQWREEEQQRRLQELKRLAE